MAEQDLGSVVVALATYARPRDLERCLSGIGEMSLPSELWNRRVIVVDNDPSGSAEDIARSSAGRCDLDLVYEIEAEPGISAARNRCLSLAAGHEFLAFLDDDEWPASDWLARLVDTARHFEADFVGGPVLPVFDSDPPRWATAAGVFDKKTHATGLVEGPLATNNLLIRIAVQNRLGTLFNPAYGLTGGSDRELTLRAQAAGLRLAWDESAIVCEKVSPGRISLPWALRRSYRVGNAMTRIDRDLGRSGGRVRTLVRGLGTSLRGVGAMVKAAPSLDVGRAVRALRHSAMGAGVVAAALGINYAEYRRTK